MIIQKIKKIYGGVFPALLCQTSMMKLFCEIVKGYLRYKTITSQNVSSEAQVKNFFYFVAKLCSVPKIFKFLYFQSSYDLPNL